MKLAPYIDEVRSWIEPIDTEEVRDTYRAGEFPRAELVNDLDKRYRWDLWWTAVPYHVRRSCYMEGGAADAHVDTLLRRIVPPLRKEVTE